MKFSLAAIAAGLVLGVGSIGCAKHESSSASNGVLADASKASGPTGYHAEYQKVSHTLITIEDFDVRTEEGDVIHIDTNPMQVDLNRLAGFAQGLNLDLTGATFPGGATQIHVAEIVTKVKSSGSPVVQFTDGTDCKLSSLPKTLNLYTSAAITLGHAAYHVKVGFTALNGIQIDEDSKSSCDCDKDKDKDKDNDKAVAETSSSHNHDDCQTNRRICKLVNPRQPVTSAPLAADDNF